MSEKIYHGGVQILDIANALVAAFNRPPWRAQKIASGGKRMAVQIMTRPQSRSGGKTALTVTLQQLPNGVLVKMGEQAWVGLAASLGKTALLTALNPRNLLHRLDDLAQDWENLQLSENVWEVIEETCRLTGASHDLAQTLDKIVCEYCGTANPLEAAHCLACGAPLRAESTPTCPHCGFPIPPDADTCPHCDTPLRT